MYLNLNTVYGMLFVTSLAFAKLHFRVVKETSTLILLDHTCDSVCNFDMTVLNACCVLYCGCFRSDPDRD